MNKKDGGGGEEEEEREEEEKVGRVGGRGGRLGEGGGSRRERNVEGGISGSCSRTQIKLTSNKNKSQSGGLTRSLVLDEVQLKPLLY